MVYFLILIRCSKLIENAVLFALENLRERDNISESEYEIKREILL